ncbi:Fe-S cluster assembly protein SufD [Marinilongibacter aquaticus]|uniref:Fe-S cluster assembly protein SufD n=1 Tax=Marinilongibacter aquaticus TaxID=2975157 RepID=UPI0021BDC60C|nr:Fe-S cluster assembly protein SufD [Marinilongibacter aquaticus]UBM59159.1 Fe-S cluster assembly protein SufD [Marinilongibacter aquaticus]
MSEKNLQSQIESEFKALESSLNGQAQESFNQRRIQAISNFKSLGIPTTKHEEWKYSNLRSLAKQEFNFHPKSDISAEELDSFHLPELEGIVLYFINGVYHPEFSTLDQAEGKVQVMTFQQAQKENPELLNTHYGKYSDNETEAFTAMNTALANDGIIVHVPDNVEVELPIILRMVSDTREEQVAAVIRNLVIVGKQAKVKIAESYRSFGDKASFVNTLTEVMVSEEAHVDYYKVQDESDLNYHVGTTNVYQKDKSYFYSATVTINGGFVRNNLNLTLDGEYIDSYMYGLYVPNENQHVDNHTVADHRKPNSISNELYKGILMDSSTGVFNGKIFVREDAQKTNAYQNCRNVVTSDKATMNTKPQLEIWADDVKCSHGTTTGKLNDEAIFYMRSRGIPKEEAIRLQLLAFAEDVVSQIKIDKVREFLAGRIKAKLG